MTLKFIKDTSKWGRGSEPGVAYLWVNNWDDFSFKTTFRLTLIDPIGTSLEIGEVKIGYAGQGKGWASERIPDVFETLPASFFSLGQSTEYYSALRSLPPDLRDEILFALRDVVRVQDALAIAMNEDVFQTSLLRSVNYASIKEQFQRILDGGAVRTEYHFGYRTAPKAEHAEFALTFDVHPSSKPSQNIHVLIGRNGIGKTTLLNGMIASLMNEHQHVDGAGQFFDMAAIPQPIPITNGYFSGIVSVSFSAFDPFNPPPDRSGAPEALKYSYIGLKEIQAIGNSRTSKHKDLPDLAQDFLSSLMGCFGLSLKRERWLAAIRFLESDSNFKEMDLARLTEIHDQEELKRRAAKVFLKMSSGHAVVLLTITRLIEKAEEKTLVLMDEPESHLHPPLLSAFTRSLSDLLHKINGVAIIATHSPVVLQEVPRSCVWKLRRTRLSAQVDRPELETFGENVGTLTREVFGLEVTKSGFHDVLSESVAEGKSFDQIMYEFSGQIGFEGRALLMALVADRDSSMRSA